MKRTVAVILTAVLALCFAAGCAAKDEPVTIDVSSYFVDADGAVVIPTDAYTTIEERTAAPTAEPTAVPTATPEPTQPPATPQPTPAPTPKPTAAPTPSPSHKSSPTPAPTPTQEPITAVNYVRAYINANGVNLRKSPSTSAQILATLSSGKNVYITGKNSKWYRVDTGSLVGFVAKQFVSLGTQTTPTPKPTPKPTPTPTPKPTPTPTPKPTTSAGGYFTVSPGEFSDDDIRLVAKLITKEAPGGTQTGLRAIASVVLNRVKNSSHHFPNTVSGVIYQQGQFYPEGALDNVTPSDAAVTAARYVFREHGATLPEKVLFYKASYLGTTWYSYLEYYCTIEGNNFFKAISHGY